MSKTAFIGLGAMGSRMAANLLKAGHEVTVYDPTPKAAETLISSGARTAASPREAAKAQAFECPMVPNIHVTKKVCLNPNTGALAGMEPKAVAIESSTVTPAWIRELGGIVGKAGTAFLEAPVSGSTPQAESAQLIFMIGGDAEALKQAEPVLKAMGSSIRHPGPIGAGALAKLITNTLMGVELTTLAEMIGMLKKQEVDAKRVLDAVAATALWNPHLTNDSESMLSGNFETHFPIKLLAKDLGYTVETAGGEASVPTVSAALALFQRAMNEQLGDLNMTAVVKLFDK